MGTISANTFRRIYLLYLLGQFQRGSYGHLRLQKVTYISQRDKPPLRPFQYKKHHFGQYSDEVTDIKDQLTSMGYIVAVPLDTARVVRFTLPEGQEPIEINFGGNRLFLRDRTNLPYFRQVLESLPGSLPRLIDDAVQEYGYLREEDLLTRCYQFPEFVGLKDGDIVIDSNLPEAIEVSLSDEECEDLDLAMSPKFMVSMTRLVTAIEEADIDWTTVRKVESLPVPRA